MNLKNINARYKFSMGAVDFEVELDDTLYAVDKFKNYLTPDKKSLHYHPMHEVYFVLDEGIKLNLENEVLEYTSCMLSVPPNKKHYAERKTDYRFLFSCTPRGAIKDEFSNFFINKFTTDEIYHIPRIKNDVVDFLYDMAFHFKKPQSVVIDDVIISFLKLIFFHIYIINGSQFLNIDKYSNESRYIIVSRIINECTTPGRDVTIATIAEALHLSEKQASKIIFKYYGKQLSDVVNEEKLNYAIYLLTHSDTPIAEIAYKCNFHSENYFFHLFKKKFGSTPLRYRKEHLKK